MGWWPFGISPGQNADRNPDIKQPPTGPSKLLPPTTTSTSASPSEPLTRDQQAEAELNAFLASLEAPKTDRSPTPTTSSSTTSTTSPNPEDSGLDISPSALRPRTMSCRQAFDSAFYCASLGGKFNDIYRFGSLQPCSEHWDAFWFCMRTKSYGNERERGDAIAKYYTKREAREKARRAGGKSSEDVWEMRTMPVEKAFWKVP